MTAHGNKLRHLGRPLHPNSPRRKWPSMGRIRFILIGAVAGIAWAASLRAFMMVLAGSPSTFTFTGTFGIIIPTGMAVGALFGLAEYQHRVGHQYPVLIATPLLVGIVPLVEPGALQALVTTGD